MMAIETWSHWREPRHRIAANIAKLPELLKRPQD
jgi:hypothetical protein